jgi:hypothetical protein
VSAEKSRLSVAFGFVLVTWPATGLDVGVAGRPIVGDRINVVVLQAPASSTVGALAARELRYGTQIEGGPQFDGLVAAKTFDGLYVDPIVQHRLEKGVPGEFFGQADREGATIDQVAHLASMRMAAPPCEEIAHDHQLGSVRPFLFVCFVASGEGCQGIGATPLPRFGGGAV